MIGDDDERPSLLRPVSLEPQSPGRVTPPEGRLGTLMQDTLADFCDRTDILDKAAVLDLVCRQRDPRSWYLFNLALWWKAYLA